MFLGDIYICIPRAHEQAEEYGHSFKREICFLAVHGIFHLLGYDHMNPHDEKDYVCETRGGIIGVWDCSLSYFQKKKYCEKQRYREFLVRYYKSFCHAIDGFFYAAICRA